MSIIRSRIPFFFLILFILLLFITFSSFSNAASKKSSTSTKIGADGLPIASKPQRLPPKGQEGTPAAVGGKRPIYSNEKKEGRAPLPPGVTLPSAKIIGRRPPGTLLLNMLIKNEAEHLERTLPKWAEIIDYWIIGVDDNNTDHSEQVIQKYLGHIPGSIVIVHFDGMGPTWTILVQEGLKRYPQATHGIIADADYIPINNANNFDKMELDIRCSKHMYTIWTQDRKNERKMDWIYRNIPGVRVLRRTHQILEAPELPDQEVFQTLINLHIEEREGGYGDRSGKKNERYISWLEKDLLEYPGDTRTLYYLGYAHFDIFSANKDQPLPVHWKHLEQAVYYFKTRADMENEGNQEERWFALLKLGEIYERFYKNWPEAEKYYSKCTESDPERADAWFYIGQHYRLWGDALKSKQYLYNAASLEIPERSLFQWLFLYHCLSKLEYGRTISAIPDNQLSLKDYKTARKLLKQSDCTDGEKGEKAELKSLITLFDTKIIEKKSSGSGGKKNRILSIKKLIQFLTKHLDAIDEQIKEYHNEDDEDDNGESILFGELLEYMKLLEKYVINYKKLEQINNNNNNNNGDNDNNNNNNEEEKSSYLSCRNYRRTTSPYIKFIKTKFDQFENYIQERKIITEWKKLNAVIQTMCR